MVVLYRCGVYHSAHFGSSRYSHCAVDVPLSATAPIVGILEIIAAVGAGGIGVLSLLVAAVVVFRIKLSRFPLMVSASLGAGLLADICETMRLSRSAASRGSFNGNLLFDISRLVPIHFRPEVPGKAFRPVTRPLPPVLRSH